MSQIKVNSGDIKALMRANHFSFSEIEMTILAIRGARPVGDTFHELGKEHSITVSPIDYTNANCTFIIWNPINEELALFPGSTVPHLQYVKRHLEKKALANCMMTGYYSFYKKAFHNPNENYAHQALKLATNIVYRRTNNDLVFTNTDPIEVGNPSDNIHASYGDGLDSDYSSAGCQVIVGQPKCKARGENSQNTRFWRYFFDIIDSVPQSNFDYTLLTFNDISNLKTNNFGKIETRLRFGSKGNTVKALQEKLKEQNFFYTNIDGDFGANTLRAVLAFQENKLRRNKADGVVGKETAKALGLELPVLSL
jgi:hypothetical protein